MDLHETAAGKRSYIWLANFIEREIPCRDRATRVTQDFSESFAPLRPVGRVIRPGVIGTALGPVHFDIWIGTLHAIDPFNLADVSVPGDGVRIFVNAWSFEFTNCPSPQVVVVVDDPNLRLHSGTL